MTDVPAPPSRAVLLDIERTCTYYNVRRATRTLAEAFDRALRPHGLLGTQFTLLVAVALLGDATVGRLAQVVGADRTTLSRTLTPLEREGLVASARGDDRRQRRLHVTERGSRAIAQALPAWRRAQGAVVATMGEDAWLDLLAGARAVRALEGLEPERWEAAMDAADERPPGAGAER